MSLNPSFQQRVMQLIDNMIDSTVQRFNVQDDSTEKMTWKYEHSFDYHYGRIMGLLTCMISHEFEKFYHREPTMQEQTETARILDQNSVKIRSVLAFLK